MRTTLRFVALVLLATSIGCSVLEPRHDGSRYFLLRSIAEAPNGPPLSDVVLGLGPVTVPDYLDRPEMIDLVDLGDRYPHGTAFLDEDQRGGIDGGTREQVCALQGLCAVGDIQETSQR